MQGHEKRRDVEKEDYWRKVIRQAARSGVSIRPFCQGRRLKESQFYWWQRELPARPARPGKERHQARTFGSGRRGQATRHSGQATFGLVIEDGGDSGSAGIELGLRDGRRLQIGKAVDKETLRTVVGVLEERC